VAYRIPIDLFIGEHSRLENEIDAALDCARAASSGACDGSGELELAVAALCSTVRRHIEAETQIVHPLLDPIFPEAKRSLEVQHLLEAKLVLHLETALGDLRSRWEPQTARSFEMLLHRFVAALLTHMEEEEALMPLLRELLPFDELRAAAERLGQFSDAQPS
jgi:hypothetical protein